MFFLFLVLERSHAIALRRRHNEIHRKKHETRLSIHRFVHNHVMKKKRRFAHAEGEDESEYYLASKRVMDLDVIAW